MLEDDDLALEEKLDGHRVVVQIDNNTRSKAFNRSGDPSQHQSFFSNAVWKSHWYWLKGQEVILDGEFMPSTGTYHCFDVIYIEDVLNQDDPWYVRRGGLTALMNRIPVTSTLIEEVPTAQGFEQKATLIEQCLTKRAEGIMVKHASARYYPGQRHGAWSKVKFTRTADLIVSALGVEGKHNAALSYVESNGDLIEVGRCSLIGKPKVHIGDVVEVRYLYIGKGERLYQPSFLRIRNDKKITECTKEQLV